MKYHYNSVEELPLFLNAKQVEVYLCISKSAVYNLLHSDGFPLVMVGKRMMVERKKFLKWIEDNTAK